MATSSMQIYLVTNPVVGRANTSGGLERAAVEGNAHVDLAGRRAVGEVELDGLVSGDVGAGTTVEVGLVVGLGRKTELAVGVRW